LYLFHRSRFGFIRSTTFGDGLIHHVGNPLQPGANLRSRNETIIQGEVRLNMFWQFIIH
jgi:hypothetical protein